MKLKDLIGALAAEIDSAGSRLADCLARLATLDEQEPGFVDALDEYSGQAQRMGDAAEMAGFPGLQAVCWHVMQNCLLLAATPAQEREPLVEFLRKWPPLMVFYLRNLEDPSAAAGLLDHLCTAPDPLPEDEARKLMHVLGAMPLQLEQADAGEGPQRPVVATAEDVALALPDDVEPRLMEGFQLEAPEQARHLVTLARNMTAGGDLSDVVAAKRVAHTLKGSASIIGLRGIASVSHHLEDILEHLEEDGAQLAPAAAEALLDAAYCLEQMVGYVLGADDYPQQARRVLQDLLDIANRIDRGEPLGSAEPRAAQEDAPEPVQHAPATAAGNAVRVSVQRVEELFRLSGELGVHGAAMEARLKALAESSRQLLAQNLRVQKRLFELETLVDVRTLATLRGRPAAAAGSGFDALEMDQYSELHSTSHALVEEAADARALAARLHEDIAGLHGLHAQQQRVGKDMQHLVIGTRMTEVGGLEARLQRNIRATCQATGKQAQLQLVGAATLIDADVLTRLAEPLLHLLRNAVDHGIEPPERRIAAGKPATGTVVLEFARQGQQVVLRCRDDGRGLDLAAVRRRAVERGLATPDQRLSDEETARLVLQPGFSTRDQVSEVSGRGVGLDVVNEWVIAMNGSVRISTQAGQGSTIELRFAASLTTQHCLVVEAAGERFALPSVHVEQAVPRGIGAFERIGSGWVWRDGQRACPARPLASAVGLAQGGDAPTAQQDVVLVRVDNRLQALAVDRLLDSRELLLKHPGRFARHMRGLAGLSILGDGSLAAHLELAPLLATQARATAAPRASTPVAADARHDAPGVLIVDDSVTVRSALRQLVQDAGFRAEAARDGLEAIEALRGFTPRAVLTDLEMPNMNGVELTAHLRGRADMKNVPVIMITSRSQEKHRRLAQQAGVDTYLTKPYNDGELLQALRQAVAA